MKGLGQEDDSQNKKDMTHVTNTSKEKLIEQAFKFHSQGNISEAKKYYKLFLDQGFSDDRVLSNIGQILKDQGNPKEAELNTRKAIEMNPTCAIYHSNLGGILIDLEYLKEAEISTRKAIQLNPNIAKAHSNLGNILRDLGNLKEAEIATRKAIQLNPNIAIAHSNLGNILRDLGNLKEAEIATRKAIQLNPNIAIAHSNLGNILKDLGNLKEAEIATRKAIQLNPNFAIAHSNLGNILKDLGRAKEAALSQRKAIEINPNFTNAYFNLFQNHEQINNLERLKESLKEFSNIDIIQNEILLFSARLNFRNKEYQIANKLINRISNKWIEKSNNYQKTIFWNYKGFIEDKVGDYDSAYSCFQKSQNESSYSKFSKDSYLKLIDSYKESINKETTNNNTFRDDINDSDLVFLIGFPRSGTTLLDTVLRSHPDIEVIEEKPLISTIEKLIKEKLNIKPNNIFKISENNISMLRKKYFELLEKYTNKKVKLIIDKLPLHTVYLPLINLLFPSAKIIFTHRHPYDTVLSCFQQPFEPNDAMANLVSLKSSSIMYDKVMCAWDLYKYNLPLDFITLKYENLVNNFDSNTLKILDFLGLEWDENVKNYRKTALDRGIINTPSSSQVVQPLYKSSINKWKNYKKYFEDCHKYLEKWISYFDY